MSRSLLEILRAMSISEDYLIGMEMAADSEGGDLDSDAVRADMAERLREFADELERKEAVVSKEIESKAVKPPPEDKAVVGPADVDEWTVETLATWIARGRVWESILRSKPVVPHG